MNAIPSIIPSPVALRPGMANGVASVPGTISCVEISFRYFRQQPLVIDGFSHNFRPGITLIKGASGCGKSTLLRLMAGYLVPNAGCITVPTALDPRSAIYQRRHL